MPISFTSYECVLIVLDSKAKRLPQSKKMFAKSQRLVLLYIASIFGQYRAASTHDEELHHVLTYLYE